jgi:Delta7-sterol 5-desaturase
MQPALAHLEATGADSFLQIAGPWALIWSVVFSTHFVRYVAFSGMVAMAVERIPAFRRCALQHAPATLGQRQRELRASIEAGGIFALQFVPLTYAMRAGWTRIYSDVDDFGWIYLFASFALALILHDTYFYWTHRWMHRPGVFRRVHLHHHRSSAPSAWAAFSFHPVESAIQGAIHWILPLVLPLHTSVLAAFVLWATFHSAIIHCGHDVLASGTAGPRPRYLGWLNTTVEHDAHHRGAPGGFALYFSFWDRWLGTCAITETRAGPDDRTLMHERTRREEIRS